MTRETRLNLIVLAVLLALLTPGAVMLFRKKLQPAVRPMFMPHAVQQEVAYTSPLETPPGKRRVEPPHTARWVESLVRQHIGQRQLIRPVDHEGLPLMSEKRAFQVVAAEMTATKVRVWLIIWDLPALQAQPWTARWVDAANTPIEASEPMSIAVPDLVRQELGEAGVTRPPHEVGWQSLETADIEGGDLRLSSGSKDSVLFVPSFTNSAATGH